MWSIVSYFSASIDQNFSFKLISSKICLVLYFSNIFALFPINICSFYLFLSLYMSNIGNESLWKMYFSMETLRNGVIDSWRGIFFTTFESLSSLSIPCFEWLCILCLFFFAPFCWMLLWVKNQWKISLTILTALLIGWGINPRLS